MSDGIRVTPAALRDYAGTAGGISSALSVVGAVDAARNLAIMAPVFGLIGEDFLAAFAVAQANHIKGITDLAAYFGAHATNATSNAKAYERVDRDHASALNSIVEQV